MTPLAQPSGPAMEHSVHMAFQKSILEGAVSILAKDSRVLGLLVTGSYARGEQDAFSDIDMACYLGDEGRSGRPELFERVGGIAPLLWKAWLYDLHALYLFENGVRLDLDFQKPGAISESEAYADASILHDPSGALGRSRGEGRGPQAMEHPKWFEPGDPGFVDWFFWMFRQIVCWAKRGEQGGYRSYEKLSSAVNSLAELRTRLVEMRLWTMGVQDYLGRVDPAFAARLARTYPRLEAGEIIGCAKLLLDEYEYACPLYCEKAGCEYPARKLPIIRRLIAEFEGMAPRPELGML
jgi:hypothetical protein